MENSPSATRQNLLHLKVISRGWLSHRTDLLSGAKKKLSRAEYTTTALIWFPQTIL